MSAVALNYFKSAAFLPRDDYAKILERYRAGCGGGAKEYFIDHGHYAAETEDIIHEWLAANTMRVPFSADLVDRFGMLFDANSGRQPQLLGISVKRAALRDSARMKQIFDLGADPASAYVQWVHVAVSPDQQIPGWVVASLGKARIYPEANPPEEMPDIFRPA